ncbi:hypothetical protein HBI73_038660 [Parastagonospora nodorum]|nr:hypothetical protein HBI73_038660 [Parastagonospora nodorum]
MNVREGYRITTLEVVKLIEDLISYLAVAKCTQLRNAQIPKVFYEAAYSAKVKIEDLSNTLTLILSETAQRQSLSVVSNRSTALITNKFSVALLTKLAILNNANVALVDAVHHSVQKLEENYFKVIDALTMTLIKDDDDLLGTVNSHIKLRRLRARCKTEAADSRHAKVSRGRTKKDKDLEDSNTSSDVPRLRRRDRAAAHSLLDSDDYRLDSSLDINSKDNLEDEEATTAKDLTREQKERLKALLNAKTRDSLSVRTEVQNARAEGDAIEYNAVDNNDKLYPTKGERTFYCACKRSLSFNAESQQAATIITTLRFCFFSDSPSENIGRLTKEEAIEMRINTTNAISKALATANKLVALQKTVYWIIPEANTPAVHSKATKHFCSFGKVDKHIFRAYNTISVTAQRTIICKGGSYVEKRAILLSSHVTALSRTPIKQGLNEILIFVSLALISLQNRKERDSVTSDCIYKIEDARNIIANVKHDASEYESSYDKLISGIKSDFLPYFQSCLYLDFLSTVQNAEQQCRDILEKEGLNKSEASRRVIFNRFEMQAIASYPTLATLKAAQFKTYGSCKVKRFTLNSVKDLFTNLSKDYFLVREARAITKSSLKFQNLLNLCSESIIAEDAAKAANTPLLPKEVCAKILIESYKLIVQAVTWLGLREKFGDESVLRDLDRPWIIVALIAFAEAIILTEATHVLAEMCVGIVYFNSDSELELKVLGKQDVKTTSQDKL